MDQPSVFIITGTTASGKTTYLLDLVNELQRAGIQPGGFVSERSHQQDSFFNYSIRDVQSGRSLPLSSRSAVQGWTKIRHFYFNPEGMDLGKEILASARNSGSRLVVIDEIGPFELEGKIWSGSIELLLSQSGPAMVWVVRAGIVDAILQKWKLKDPVIINIADLPVLEAVKKILSKLESTS